MTQRLQQRLVLVTGWTGAGKSTIADAIATDLGATVAGFDWLMSALRADPEVWDVVSRPVERQRETGGLLLGRVAEQQLRRGSSCILDVVARHVTRERLAGLAVTYGARFDVVECVCSDEAVHRSRVIGRNREIPGWYELDWEHVRQTRASYVPLPEPKCVIDAVDDLATNVEIVRHHLGRANDDHVDQVTDVEPGDQAEVRALVLDGLREHWGSLDESLNRDLDGTVEPADGRRIVAVRRAGLIIATGALAPRDPATAEIVRMSVHRAHRREGLGRTVVNELLATAACWGMQRVILETSSAWSDVVHFYQSCGFRITHHAAGEFGEDTWFAIDVME